MSDESTNEDRRPTGRSSQTWVYVSVVVGVVVVVGVIMFAMFFHQKDRSPGSISNTPSASSPEARGSGEKESPTGEKSADVDTAEVSSRLGYCVDKATQPDDVSELAGECFFSYREHLADIYGIRDYGTTKMGSVSVEDAGTAKVSVKINNDKGREMGTVTAYWLADSRSFKVVDTKLTDYARAHVRDDVLKKVENQR